MRAEQSGLFVGWILRRLAKKLESYLLLVTDDYEEKGTKPGSLTEQAINHKLTKVIKHQMRKPLYIVGLLYGCTAAGVGYFLWKM